MSQFAVILGHYFEVPFWALFGHPFLRKRVHVHVCVQGKIQEKESLKNSRKTTEKQQENRDEEQEKSRKRAEEEQISEGLSWCLFGCFLGSVLGCKSALGSRKKQKSNLPRSSLDPCCGSPPGPPSPVFNIIFNTTFRTSSAGRRFPSSATVPWRHEVECSFARVVPLATGIDWF